MPLLQAAPQEPSGRHIVDQEVLPLAPVRQRLRDDLTAANQNVEGLRLRQEVSPQAFFYGLRPQSLPDEQLEAPYFDVKLTRVDKAGPGAPSLTHLLRLHPSDGTPAGVLLQARSGAGKTLAGWKAFFDCACGHWNPNGTAASPRLAGAIPCRLPHADTAVLQQLFQQLPEKGEQSHPEWGNQERLVVALLTVATGQLPVTNGQAHPSDLRRELDRLQWWLRYSPPIILLIDLNAASEQTRPVLATALIEFQHRWPRHRSVVTYRTVNQEDETLKLLTKSGEFVGYDLQPVYEPQARQYLRHIRHWEDVVRARFGLPPRARVVAQPGPQTDPIESEVRLLSRFIRQHAAQANSLVSTPLLMHWVSQVQLPTDDEELDRWTLSDLYRSVVDQQLAREQQAISMPAGLTNVAVLLVAVRLALFLLTRGANSTRATFDEFQYLLEHPAADTSWHPAPSFWKNSRYLDRTFSAHDAKELLEYGVLQREHGQIGFLHDSLIYYFAALSLREWIAPGSPPRSLPLSKEHAEALAKRLHAAPDMWEQGAEFLGGLWRPRFDTTVSPEHRAQAEQRAEAQLCDVVQALVCGSAKAGVSRVLQNLLRGGGRWVDSRLRKTQVALQKHGPYVHQRPLRLVQEVTNYLAFCGDDSCHNFARQMLANRVPTPGAGSWFQQRSGPPATPELVLSEHTGEVTCLAVLPDGRVVSGSADNTVRVWDPATGDVRMLTAHTHKVTCLAVFPDGRVVSGSDDRTVRVWDPAHDPAGNDVRVLTGHIHWVRCVAVLPDGRVVSGSNDRTVRFWDPATGASEWLHRPRSIHAIATSPQVPGRLACLEGGDLVLLDVIDG